MDLCRPKVIMSPYTKVEMSSLWYVVAISHYSLTAQHMTLITMSAKEIDRFAVITKLINKQFTASQAAEQLHLSVRHVKRIKKRVKKQGPQGLIHRSRGRESNRKFPKFRNDAILKLLNTRQS